MLFLLLARLLCHKEPHWLSFAGRAWIGVGLWFLVQYILLALSGTSIIVKLLTLPAMTAGNSGFLAGTIMFLLGGVALAIAF